MAKIIFLNGPPRSGKDTIADYLKQNCKNVVTLKFASHLKRVAHALAGLYDKDENAFEDCKDTPNEAFPFNPISRRRYSPREWYIYVAENVIKPTLGVVYFGTTLLNKIKEIENELYQDSNVNFVISDSRFLIEAEPLIYHQDGENCHLVHVERPSYTFVDDSGSYWKHPSCTKHHMYNSGSLELLFERADDLIINLKLERRDTDGTGA